MEDLRMWDEEKMLTLALLDAQRAQPETMVVLDWGEEGTRKPTVEPHGQVELRAVVSRFRRRDGTHGPPRL
jgi:hypothetical protein